MSSRALAALAALVIVVAAVAAALLAAHPWRGHAAPGSQGGGGAYTIRAATLQGGISTLDIIEALNLTGKRGYPLRVLRLQKTPDIIAAISKGEADLAVVPAEMAARLIEDGGNIVIVAVDMLQNQAVLSRDPSIKSLADLKGRLVGAVVASGTYKIFKAYAETVCNVSVVEGEKPSEGVITVVNVPPGSILDALRTGRVDAIVIWEPFVSKGIVEGLHVVETFQDLWHREGLKGEPVMLVWIARKDFVDSHPDALKAFLDARSEAARIWVSEKGVVFKILGSLYRLDNATLEVLYNRTKIVGDGLTGELINSIRSEWWLAWRGGYLPRDPASICDCVFYRG